MNRIKLSEPELDDDIAADITYALAQKEVGYEGTFIQAFKQALSAFFSAPNVGLFSSGTSSIHLALKSLGIGEGDEVVCQSLTFAASANPVRFVGANPVFVGSEKETWNLCPIQLERALEDRRRKGKKVKAIIPVHIFGMPAKMREIMEIAEHYELPVIEDAAEALGSRIDGKLCGTIGDIGVFSFNANKIITTGGGGALLTKRKVNMDQAYYFALQAKDPAPHYEHSQIGYNYAFSNLNAVLGCSQFKKLNEKIIKRKRNFEHYVQRLSEVEGLAFQNGEEHMESNRWLSAATLADGQRLANLKNFLAMKNIETRPVWKPMHLQPLYSTAPYYGEKHEEYLFSNGICLPSGSGLSEEQLHTVTASILQVLKK